MVTRRRRRRPRPWREAAGLFIAALFYGAMAIIIMAGWGH